MKIQVLHLFKEIIAHAAIILVILHAFYQRFEIKTNRYLVNVALVVLALLSAWAFYDFGHYLPQKLDQPSFKLEHAYPYVNRHDFFHYYMGSKYSHEIGYLNLYHAALVVDRENDPKFRQSSVRNQENYEFTPVREVMAKADEYKALFTEARWKEFTKDTLFFRNLMGESRWQRALRDKGYNATPTWNAVARVITNALSVEDTMSRNILMWLDILMALIMFGAIAWAFGWRTMLFALCFFGVNFMMNETHIKGSLLRWDWVTLLVISICLVKRGYYLPAGLCMGYAAMSRIFPAVFLFGMGAKVFWELWRWGTQPGAFSKESLSGILRNPPVSRKYIVFFVAFAVAAGALFTFSVVTDRGMDTWNTYQKIITMHNDDVVEVRTGFKYVFLGTYERTGSLTEFKAQKNQEFHDRRFTWWLIQAIVLGASLFFVRKLSDDEGIAYGFVPAYFLVAPTFYYYIMLVAPLLLFAPKIVRPSRAFGLCLMFGISILGYEMFSEGELGLNYPLFYYLSLANLGFAAYIMFASFTAEPPVEPVAAPEPAKKKGKTKKNNADDDGDA